jgi:hypothetical protein
MSKLDRTFDAVGKGVNRVQIGCLTIFFNLFFAGFCLWGVYAAYTGWQLQTGGERTTGTVIEMEESSSAESGCCVYSPVVQFEVNGQSYTFDSGNASDPPQYEVGEQVEVLYNPTDPNTAQIDSLFERWAFPVCIIPSMIIAAVVMNFFMFRSFRRGESIGE